jgi:hypothetical protein
MKTKRGNCPTFSKSQRETIEKICGTLYARQSDRYGWNALTILKTVARNFRHVKESEYWKTTFLFTGGPNFNSYSEWRLAIYLTKSSDLNYDADLESVKIELPFDVTGTELAEAVEKLQLQTTW